MFSSGEVFVCAGEVSSGEGSNDGEFSSEDQTGGDFREGAGVVWSGESHELEAGILSGESGASADGADHDTGEGDGGVEVAVI